MGLRLELLGPARVLLDGRAVRTDTRKATALLAYLAMQGRDVARESAAALLWPDTDPARAHGALRRTLSTLRKALGGEFLAADRRVLHLDRDRVVVDVDEFRQAAADASRPRLEAAAVLYRGDFLDGFALRDAPDFEDWQIFESEGLRREFASVLERLVRAADASGDAARAIGHARRWLALDPLQESAHRELVRLYALAGDRAAATRQYRECVAVLDRELGVAPLEETAQTYRLAVEDRVAPAGGPAPPEAALRTAALPMVGRSAELASLVRAFDGIREDGMLAVVEGEAGVGKTRLVDELAPRVRPAIAVRGHEDEAGLAYGPVIEALRAAHRSGRAAGVAVAWRAEAARLVPELGPPAEGDLDSPVAQGRLLEGVATVLAAACAGGALVFDDLHWADEATLDAVVYMARRLRGRPMLVVCTWRTEDVPRGHRLRRLAAELSREGRALDVRLSRLAAADVATLAAAAGRDDPAFADRLFAETEGLPFFVVEYLHAAPDDGVPGGVLELVSSRVSAVSEAATQVLAAAAVVGRTFDASVVREASARTDEEVVAALDELVSRGLVDEAGGRYDFRHELVRRVVHEDTGLARRRLLHARAARALSRKGRPGRAPVQHAVVARHWAAAGNEDEAARNFRLAGDGARSLYANAEALSHYGSALAYGHGDAAVLHEAIGDVRTLLGDYAGAVTSLEAAASTAPGDALAGIEHKLGAVRLRAGAWELAEAHLRAALELDDDPAFAARVHADLGLAGWRRACADDATTHASRSLELATQAADRPARARAHNLLGILAARADRLGEARTHLARSLELATAAQDANRRVAALNNLARTLSALGDHDAALGLLREALAMCQAVGDRHREAAIHNNIADVLHAAGRTSDAVPHQLRANALFADVGEPGALPPAEIWQLVEW